jgi:diguanylate cyclase (GGDEF)-like protein
MRLYMGIGAYPRREQKHSGMGRWLPIPARGSLALGFLAIAGICGSLVGLIELRQAVSESRQLYRLDTVGLQIESDLEFQTQESRRSLLSALAVAGPGKPFLSADSARVTDEQVRDAIGRFRQIDAPPALTESIQDFEASWSAYARMRDDVAAAIRSGDFKGALETDQQRGNATFLAALGNLHALRQALEDHAGVQSIRVGRAFERCTAGLISFASATFFIMFALLRIRRSRARALLASNRELERAQEMARHRVAILEMVITHVPLTQTLGAIAALPSWHQPGAGAALWSIEGNLLLYQLSSGLPDQVSNGLRALSFERVEGKLNLSPEVRREIAELAHQTNLKPTVVPLENVTGDAIGLLALFAPSFARDSGPVWEIPQRFTSQLEQLACLAIENSRLYERLAFQAQHDVLTGLPNRLLFQDRLQQAILRARRNRKKVAVLWFDVDRFKQINDTLGHRVGDELLCEFAQRIKGSLRKSDTAARIGADEFAVLVAELDGASDLRVIAEKLMKQIRVSMVLSGHDLKISASAGISIFPEHGLESGVLMRNADLAMYQAKRAGRDTFQVFDAELSELLGRRLEIERELRGAIEAAEFHLEYQPLIGRHNELNGFEALLRWNNVRLGEVSPAEFIPIAEEAGYILRIGEWVANAACQEGARWIKQGLNVPSIAVNASGLQFADGSFPEMIRTALESSGFPASKLEIEVTETALVGNPESALTQITRLRDLGIRFAIDDFGTGYSSLNQLRTLPVDCVKVDRSFIKDLELTSGDSTTLVRGIIGMAHNLRLRVVAEGVETEGQLAILRSLGCDVSQGFFLHRPLTAIAAEALMRAYATDRHPAFCGDARGVPAAPVPYLVPDLA